MVFEFKRAKRMSYALHRVAYGVREIVHRVNAPLVARTVMRCVQNAVNNRVAQVDVGRSHIYSCAKDLFSVGKFARAHSFE